MRERNAIQMIMAMCIGNAVMLIVMAFVHHTFSRGEVIVFGVAAWMVFTDIAWAIIAAVEKRRDAGQSNHG